MSLPTWVEWPVATATLLATGLASIGMSTMDELAPFRIPLLVVGVSLCLVAGLVQLGALLVPVFQGIATRLRARRSRKAQSAREQAEIPVREARRVQKLQAATLRIVGAWNDLVQLGRLRYQPRTGETFAQASAREQLRGEAEEAGMRYLRNIVSTDYHFAILDLREPERQRHRALSDQLSMEGIDRVEVPLRDLVAVVFPEDARPVVDPRPSKASEQAPPS